jgi:hypothetical protein
MSAIRDWMDHKIKADESRSCNCIGPQNGEPLCPCQMRSVQIVDGRYVRINDLGPVKDVHVAIETWKCKCGATHYGKPNFCSECGAKQ